MAEIGMKEKGLEEKEVPSDEVDRDSGGELGHLLKISLLAIGSF